MNFELKSMDVAGASVEKADAVIVLVPNGFKAGRDSLSILIASALKSGDLDSKAGKTLSLYKPSQAQATRVVFAAIGDGGVKETRSGLIAAMGSIKTPTVKTLVVVFASTASEDSVRSAVYAAADASYVYTHTKSKPEGRSLQNVVIAAANASDLQDGFKHAVAIVAGVEHAKEWANRPANHATPTLLAQAARDLSKASKVRCEVLGSKDVAKLGMGSFLSVAQGSDEPLRFIVLRYDGAAKTQAPTVLIGKGITFDSGGISIKPAPEMDEMKFDMSGAASVLGVFRTVSLLKPAINVVGLIPACENLPSGRSVKPGDVVTSMSGQTIEILNTDAEGRLILCDALTYAERFKPLSLIHI